MKVLGILHLPRRKVFAAIFTIIAFLSFVGYVVFPGDTFAALREGVEQLVPVSGQGEAVTNLEQDSGGRSNSRGQDTTTTVPAPKTDTPTAKVDKERVGMPEWAQGSAPFPSELTLPDPEPTAPYFAHLTPDRRCFKKGTDLPKTFSSPNNDTKCHCLTGYHGDECGVPSPVWHAADFEQMVLPSLSLRETARRIILAIPVNHELDLVDVRSKELGDAISATLIAESDFTAAGEPKDRFVETRARRDPSFLAPQRNRTLLLRVKQFPPEGCTDGWVSDHHSRSIIGAEGIPRLHGLQDDDFFVILDADEIPKRDVIDFLRFYDGYGEPVAFRMRWFIYGFFWESIDASKQTARQTHVEAGCSVGMLRRVYLDDPYCLRHAEWLEKDIDRAREYEDAMGKRLRTFEIGSADHPAGFHCSWCFRGPLGLQVKLVSSQLADGPRWGNYEDRLVPEYLERIVEEGEWFDGSKNLASTDFLMEMSTGNDSYKDFAPSYLLQNFDEYSPYLVNPSERRNTTLMSIYRNATKYALSDEQQRSQRPGDERNSDNNNG
ncbi:beta-1,4-mannosyl-glycoprotein 4-beta-N-acetylglucosaminyltransferase-like isoform X2 [Ischnura elegans]|uniref:beta-1,4-mannosyl-glycoprotein 4-beta-N-acetylglucosaminyltransferase-like isoform X2 n=1 Tax=Ischnura elegans TaxID=197161 RepID=UPI001ED8ABC5|nr:beta-1,4-mannosyl-glycoprotein 4-beta-N-acetylglucosaminyltransferase-like isoform X2 [Ischnura elegans]